MIAMLHFLFITQVFSRLHDNKVKPVELGVKDDVKRLDGTNLKQWGVSDFTNSISNAEEAVSSTVSNAAGQIGDFVDDAKCTAALAWIACSLASSHSTCLGDHLLNCGMDQSQANSAIETECGETDISEFQVACNTMGYSTSGSSGNSDDSADAGGVVSNDATDDQTVADCATRLFDDFIGSCMNDIDFPNSSISSSNLDVLRTCLSQNQSTIFGCEENIDTYVTAYCDANTVDYYDDFCLQYISIAEATTTTTTTSDSTHNCAILAAGDSCARDANYDSSNKTSMYQCIIATCNAAGRGVVTDAQIDAECSTQSVGDTYRSVCESLGYDYPDVDCAGYWPSVDDCTAECQVRRFVVETEAQGEGTCDLEFVTEPCLPGDGACIATTPAATPAPASVACMEDHPVWTAWADCVASGHTDTHACAVEILATCESIGNTLDAEKAIEDQCKTGVEAKHTQDGTITTFLAFCEENGLTTGTASRLYALPSLMVAIVVGAGMM